ncbi:MAG TPA: hypothetical protein VHZ09_11685 [Acidobacteriaceae bacterium]|jgi:hypothetical protein|nr:hypothetical protein [Acidobacteriaceae bacterium]
MAEKEQKAVSETVLVALVRVHLVSGEAFELLPFEDDKDVKAKVNDLLADWAKSGFLIRGSEIVPWHQVRRVEALQVEELSRDESALRRKEWEARETARLQQSFWRTKQERGKKDEEGEGEKTPRAA